MPCQRPACLFVIEHARRSILHFNITTHSTFDVVVQQLREGRCKAGPYRYFILDQDEHLSILPKKLALKYGD
jgi:hypothetical protein